LVFKIKFFLSYNKKSGTPEEKFATNFIFLGSTFDPNYFVLGLVRTFAIISSNTPRSVRFGSKIVRSLIYICTIGIQIKSEAFFVREKLLICVDENPKTACDKTNIRPI